MPIVTAVALSLFLLTMTGCATSSTPAAKQETDKNDSTVNRAKHDEEKSMNEERESQNAIMNR